MRRCLFAGITGADYDKLRPREKWRSVMPLLRLPSTLPNGYTSRLSISSQVPDGPIPSDHHGATFTGEMTEELILLA